MTRLATIPEQHRWPLLALAAAAASAALVRDLPVMAALWAVAAGVGALLYGLARPAAWAWWFVALGLLLPPLPLTIGGVELPFHPAMAALAAGIVVFWVRLPEWRIERSGVSTTSMLLLGATLISLPWAFYYSGATVGAQSAIRWVLLASGFLLMMWIAYGPLEKSPLAESPIEEWSGTGLLRMILAAALISSAFAVVDFQYQLPRTVRFSEQYIYGQAIPVRRAQGVFYDASALGNFCAMILTLILALGRNARRALQLPAWLLWIPVPALAVALVLSFSRGSLVNLIVALAALAWMRRKMLAGRSVATLIAMASAVSIAAVLIAPQLLLPYGSRLQYSAVEFFSDPNAVLSQRLDTWTDLGGFILDHPAQVLLGIGYKSLPYTSYFPHEVVADNMYLALLTESGLPGLLALLAFSGAVLASTRRMTRHPDDRIAGLGRFLFCFWLGEMAQMLSGDILTFWRVTPVYLAILGLALRYSAHEQEPA
jgi:O-antigen ligase